MTVMATDFMLFSYLCFGEITSEENHWLAA
jgi:hypothetical protein